MSKNPERPDNSYFGFGMIIITLILMNFSIETNLKREIRKSNAEIASETLLLKEQLASQTKVLNDLVHRFQDTQIIYAEELKMSPK